MFGPRQLLIPALALALVLSVTPQRRGRLPPRSRCSASAPRHAAEERALEARFDAALNAADLRDLDEAHHRRSPHHVGSPYGQGERRVHGRTSSAPGATRPQIEEFKVLFPTPKVRLLEMVGAHPLHGERSPSRRSPEDSTSGQTAEQLPIYNAYSIDGDVTGELVYVNYGVPKDYEELERRGIDVKGKIVIARYGGSWRGIKPKVAAEHGAIGCIIYSDPRDDGYFQGDVYPKGGYRNEHGAQRGSVADMPLYSGDPLTPGVGATEDAKRLAVKDAPTLTKIPVLPISYGDAAAAAQGAGRPDGARGLARRAADHLSPRPRPGARPPQARVRLGPGAGLRRHRPAARRRAARTSGSSAATTTTPGSTAPTIRSAAWSPSSRRRAPWASWRRAAGGRSARSSTPPGTARSRACSARPSGPRPTPPSCASTAVVYINSDSNRRGFFSAGGSHTLETLRQPGGPRRHRSREGDQRPRPRRRARTLVDGTPEERKEAQSGRAPPRRPGLGLGLHAVPPAPRHRLAQPRLRRRGGDGQYHSIYDSFDHYTRFVDPNFDYGMALAEDRRPGGAPAAPTPTCCRSTSSRFSDTVGRYVEEVEKLADTLRAGDRGAQPRDRRQRLPGGRRSDRDLRGAAAPRRRCRTSTSRRSRTPSRRLKKSAADYDKADGRPRRRRQGAAAERRRPARRRS